MQAARCSSHKGPLSVSKQFCNWIIQQLLCVVLRINHPRYWSSHPNTHFVSPTFFITVVLGFPVPIVHCTLQSITWSQYWKCWVSCEFHWHIARENPVITRLLVMYNVQLGLDPAPSKRNTVPGHLFSLHIHSLSCHSYHLIPCSHYSSVSVQLQRKWAKGGLKSHGAVGSPAFTSLSRARLDPSSTDCLL